MKVNLHEPSFGEEEIMAATEQMRSTKVTMGAKVREFENQCAEYFGSEHALMCNSGSSANLLAFAALSNPSIRKSPAYLEPNSIVIVPALSWATSVWPIIQCGHTPIFVDCDLNTFNFDYEKLEEAIEEYKPQAIMAVHVYGNPCDMDKLEYLCQKHGIALIEDTCESMGATFRGKKVGTFGGIGTMSLYFSHHITTFEGGLCFTNDEKLINLMRILRAHGWSRESDNHEEYVKQYLDIDPRFIFVNIGYNLRPTEVQAVIGMKQLPKLNGFIENRRNMHDSYRKGLEKYGNWFRFQKEQENGKASWFGFCITLTPECPFDLKQITSFLQSHDVETRPIIAGNMARHPALKMYAHLVSGTLENCDTVMQRGFAIGCHHAITRENVDYVLGIFEEFLKPYV